MISNKQRDIIAALVLIAIAAAVAWVAIPYGVQEPKRLKFVALSPSYYPRLVSYCLMAFAALLLIRQIVAGKAKPHTAQAPPASYRNNACGVLALVAAVLFAYYWSLTSMGFVFPSVIALIVLQFIAGERSPLAIALIAIIVPFGLYFFFTKVANIPIPSGPLEAWLLRA